MASPYVSAMQTATQRRLILARHAKAVEDEVGGDHARPLSARGRTDAEALGVWLAERDAWPDQVFCSTATRTRETLAGLGHTLPTILRDKIYMASAGDLLAQVQGSDDGVKSLMLIGHNPGMHGLLALLVGAYVDEKDAERVSMKFPTAGCAILRLDADSWKDIKPQSATLELLRWSIDG